MSLTPARVMRVLPKALYHSGVDNYTVVEPFTIYGWSEITIEELVYPVYPKANASWSKFSMIGDYWTDSPSTFLGTNNRKDYTSLEVFWVTRTTDGVKKHYVYNFYAYRNSWVHLIRRFTADREYSVWVNGEKKYSVTIPSDEKTVLEWNPDTATHPYMYERFVLGANVVLGEEMTVMYGCLRIYRDKALNENEIKHNFYHLNDPARDGLVLWLHWDSIDIGAGKWYDKSGYGNHGTIYGATLVDVIRKPVRVLSPPSRIISPPLR